MDDIDRRILATLKSQGRISWVRLAARVNLSAPACQRRVEAMVANGIISRFTAEIDHQRLGRMIHAFIHVKVDRQNVQSAKNFTKAVAGYEETQGFHKLSGNTDYMIEVVVADIAALSRFLDDRILALDGVADANTSIVLENLLIEASSPR